jgi:hypothetical protein
MTELWPDLQKKADEMMIFKMPKNESLMDEIFKFDPRQLESTSSAKLSEYAIGIMQFVVFLTSQTNKSRVLLMQKERLLELYVNRSTDIKGGTKAERLNRIIIANPELKETENEIIMIGAELKLTENYDKYLVELANNIKRELTRREAEMKFVRDERRL